MAIPDTIPNEQTILTGNTAKVLDGSEFNEKNNLPGENLPKVESNVVENEVVVETNNVSSINSFLENNKPDQAYVQVAKYSGLSSVVSDIIFPAVTYPLKKLEDILKASPTVLGRASKRETELRNNETFIGPQKAGNEPTISSSVNLKSSQNYFNRTNDTIDLNLSQIIPIKGSDNKGIPIAKNLMAEAAIGQRGKRGPLSVIDNGDGTYKLMDGNATYFAAKDMELESLPVRVLTEEQYLKEASDLKIRKAQEKVNAANFKKNVNKPIKLEDGMLSDFRAVGASGDAKIPDEKNVLQTIEGVSLTFKDKIDESKRGVITQEATRALAEDLGVNPKTLAANILGRKKGSVIISADGGGLAETMLASRELLLAEVKKLDLLAKNAENGTSQNVLDFRVQLELVGQLQSQIKGSQTEIARALGQFKIPLRGGDFDKTKTANINTILDSFGGADDTRDMARAYNLVGDSQSSKLQYANKGSKFKKFGNAMYEAWINILLSSGITHIKNMTGNVLTTLAHVGESYVAGGIGTARRAMGGDGGAYIGEGNAQLFAALMTLRESMAAAGSSFSKGGAAFEGSKLQGTQGKRFGNDFSAEGFEATGMTGNIIDIVGNFLTLGRVPTKLLEFEDAFFKTMARRMSLYQSAYRSGKQKGLEGEALSNHIGEYVYNPPDVAVKASDDHAKMVTLQTDLDKYGKHINGLRSLPGMRYFLPFFKTPYNAFKYAALDRGPLGYFFGETKAAIDAGKKPGASAADKAGADLARAKLHMGNATGASVFMMAQNGEITGGGPTDPDLRNSLRRTGWQPYSIKVGDTYYSYQAAEPFSSILGLAADAAEAMMSGDVAEEPGNAMSAALLAALANQVTNKTFMQGFSSLMKAMSDPGRYGGRTVDNFWSSIVPRIVAQTEKNVDPMQRAAYTMLDKLKAQIPYLSSDLQPRRNFWGQKVMLSGAFGPDVLSPIYSSTLGPNRAAEESNELVDDPKAAYPERAYKLDQEFIDLKFGPSKHHETWDANIGLTAKEIDLLHQYSGKRSVEQLEKVVAMPEYQNLKTAWLKNGDKLARETAETMLNSAVVAARALAKGDLYESQEFGQAIKTRIEKFGDRQKNKLQNIQNIMR